MAQFSRGVLAINRPRINEGVYAGLASMPLQTVGPVYSAYDPGQANTRLDAVGLSARDADGYRLAPGGVPFTITLMHGGHTTDIISVAALIRDNLVNVGVRAQVTQIGPGEWGNRYNANELMVTVMWSNDRGTGSDMTLGSIRRAGRLWDTWRTSHGQEGEEPPDWIKQAIALSAQIQAAIPGSAEYNQLNEAALAWNRTHLPAINVVESAKHPLIVSKWLRNVPSGGFSIAANYSAEQLFFSVRVHLPLVLRGS